jgi:hypothetical protein
VDNRRRAAALALVAAALITPGSAALAVAGGQSQPAATHHKAPAHHKPNPKMRPLPWLSGASSGNLKRWNTFRDRPSTVTSIWPTSQTWSQIAHPDQPADLASYTKAVSIGMPMFPSSGTSSFSSCAKGSDDAHFATMGRSLVRGGRAKAFLRLGWEFNGDWYRWSAANASPAVWKACWRQEVTALRSTDPHIRIVWNANQGSSSDVRGRMLRYYPGNRYVDVVGVDYYDAWPSEPNAAAWKAHYNQTEPDGAPYGLGAWLAFAISHHKKLAVPEWAGSTASGGGGDNPYYVSRMFDFFRANAAHIAYECYFDDQAPYSISGWTGPTRLPKTAARYRQLFAK